MDTNALTSILLIHSQPEEKLKRDLHKPGYRVVIVPSSVDGLRQMFQETFDLIFLDMQPGMEQVIALIERLAKMYDIPIVYL